MFKVLAIIFTVFTGLYLLLSAAIVYHLKQFLPPKHAAASLVITTFLLVSTLFWLFALYFLLQLR